MLKELDADTLAQPVFRALTVTGRLANRKLATRRGRMKGGAVNDRVQLLASRAGIPYVGGRQVRAHSLRASLNTDTIAAGVSLRERNRRGRCSPDEHGGHRLRPAAGRSTVRSAVPRCMGGHPAAGQRQFSGPARCCCAGPDSSNPA